MKELSIEEKAHNYDEAIKRANSLLSGNQLGNAWIYRLLPELEEFEDEKIREKLIDYFSASHAIDTFKGVPWDRVVVWLEKQGEQKPADKIQLGKEYKCIASPRYSAFMTGSIYKPEDKFLCSLMNFCSDCFEPVEDDEQKPNKVKPKFKVGDWVVNTITGNVEQIIEVTSNEYICSGTLVVSFDNQHLLNRWTIQDAKDGDVLAASDGSIFLFAGVVDLACKYYVALTTDGAFKFNEGLEHYWETSTAVHPAPKEQRDLLFQKMHEAGYEWDAEKKELKKKSTEEYNITGIGSKHAQGKLGEMIKNLKSAWSEEDDIMAHDIDYALRCQITYPITKLQSMSTWVNNLKNRVQPQLKQEWSEEDIAAVSRVISIVKWAAYSDHSHPILNDKGATELIEQLNSIKDRCLPQPKQEWSKEDELNIKRLIRLIEYNEAVVINGVTKDGWIDWLKSLKERYYPQNHWKPTEEHIKVLSIFADNMVEPYYKGVILDLLEQLKVL